jgi:HTH-type transcriptional regulator / antitoxin HipB
VAAGMEAWLQRHQKRSTFWAISPRAGRCAVRTGGRWGSSWRATWYGRPPTVRSSGRLGARADREILEEKAGGYGLSAEEAKACADLLRGDDIHAQTLTRQARHIGSYLASTHWSLLEFREAVITADERVTERSHRLCPSDMRSIEHISVGRLLLLQSDHMNTQDTPITFGAAIRERRRELGLAQQDVADVIGVNRRVIGQLESGKSTVQLRIALEAARAVGLDLRLQARGEAR